MKKLVFITNIPTPYRTAFYDALQKECRVSDCDLSVLYCATTEPKRRWPYKPEEMHHNHVLMWGIHPRLRGFITHLNPEVWTRLSKANPDIVVMAGAWNTPTVLLALLWCKLKNKPALFWSEGHSDAVLNKKGPIAFLRRSVYRLFDGFTVPNSKSAAWAAMQSGGGAKTILLPNSIDTTSFYPPAEITKQEIRAKLGLPLGARIFVQVARLDPEKAPAELISAFLRIPTETKESPFLVLVGPGSQEDKIREMCKGASERVLVTGNVPASQVREWLWASDIFILNTKRDPNPLSPIEASSAKMPIMMSRLAGNVSELVEEGRTGWIINDPCNPLPELTDAIAVSDERLASMGSEAQRSITERFDVQNVARRLIADLQDAYPA